MAALKGDDGPAVGIDLGTTYSCVAVWRNDRGEVIPNDQGNLLTPSCVAFAGAERFVGDAAVNQAALNPANTIHGEKLCIFLSICFYSIGRSESEQLTRKFILLLASFL
jgi:L1 cell adhesion molecule like protein